MRIWSALALSGILGLGAQVASAQTPLLHYTFDEASSGTTNALDTGTPPPSDGVFNGGATRTANTPSGSGGAVDLTTNEATGGYAFVRSAADADKLDGLSKVTISTWLNLSSYPTPGSSNARLVSKQAAGNFGGYNFTLNGATNDGGTAGSSASDFRIGLFIGNNVSSGGSDFGAAYDGVDVDAANKWIFLAVTYDNSVAAGNTKFYIGGVNTPVTQLGADQTLPQITIDGGTALPGVGYTDAAPTADTSPNGFMDDARVYGDALSRAQLEAIRVSNVPEPASVLALLLGGGMLLGRRRRDSRRA
jgi:hypothetical protein